MSEAYIPRPIRPLRLTLGLFPPFIQYSAARAHDECVAGSVDICVEKRECADHS
jgi:hypothetical protein